MIETKSNFDKTKNRPYSLLEKNFCFLTFQKNMKKQTIVLLLLTSFILVPTVHGFRDVGQNSKLAPILQDLIQKKVIDEGTYFRPSETVPAQMFWETVIRDTGFDKKSATFNTPLPPNITDQDPIAQYLREAIRRKLINGKNPLDEEKPITKREAITIFTKLKGVVPLQTPSKIFLDKFPKLDPSTPGLSIVEAAYASKILEDSDIQNLDLDKNLTREDFIRWVENFNVNTDKKVSLNPRGRKVTPNEQSQIAPSEKKQESLIQINVIPTNQENQQPVTTTTLQIPNGAIFLDIFQTILEKYRFADQLTREKEEKMIDGAISGMVSGLGDKYSTYIEPSESQSFTQDISGKFEGIGAYVEVIEGKITITAPIPDSPAMKAGILPGDIITKVDDISVEGKTINDVVNMIKGPEGTNVKLTILRNGTTQDITVMRAKIIVPSVTVKYVKSIPVINIHKFTTDAKAQFQDILTKEILPKKPKGIIFDLRNDPGGLLTSAVDLGEFFVDKNTLLFSIEYKNGKQEFHSSRQGELFGQKNIVVLQNKGTASAAEIFSSMIQDYKRGTIVWTPSLGKGTVQEVMTYANGGILKLTIAKWLTPLGHWIQDGDKDKQGVLPDITVPDPTADEIKNNIDHQLDTAVNTVLGNH